MWGTKPVRAPAGYAVSVYHSFHGEVEHHRRHWWQCARCRCVIPPSQDRCPGGFFRAVLRRSRGGPATEAEAGRDSSPRSVVKRAMNRPPSAKDCREYRTDPAKVLRPAPPRLLPFPMPLPGRCGAPRRAASCAVGGADAAVQRPQMQLARAPACLRRHARPLPAGARRRLALEQVGSLRSGPPHDAPPPRCAGAYTKIKSPEGQGGGGGEAKRVAAAAAAGQGAGRKAGALGGKTLDGHSQPATPPVAGAGAGAAGAGGARLGGAARPDSRFPGDGAILSLVQQARASRPNPPVHIGRAQAARAFAEISRGVGVEGSAAAGRGEDPFSAPGWQHPRGRGSCRKRS